MNSFSRFFYFLVVAIYKLVPIHGENNAAVESGKPSGDRDLVRTRGWWSSSSTKTSKSTDHPTLFPTMYPTLAPTYCGKSGKSGSKSTSCWSGSWSSSSWHSSWSRVSRDGQKKKHKKHRGHHDSRDLEYVDEVNGQDTEIPLTNVRRRRINGGKPVYVGERVP